MRRCAVFVLACVSGTHAFSSGLLLPHVNGQYDTQSVSLRCAAPPPFAVSGISRWQRERKVLRRATLSLQTAADWQQATDPDTGKIYYYCAATGETSWEMPADDVPAPAAAPAAATTTTAGGLPLQFTGQGAKSKVLYKKILQDALVAVQAARGAGKRRLQIEFPLDDKDEGKTLVKRFELMSTWTEEFASSMGLPRVQRVGENIQIRDNVTPGGGGEYLTNEGIYGYRLSSADNSEQVLLVLVAGVDIERLDELEEMLGGATTVGRKLPAGVALDVASTGVLSSLDTVGYVRDMTVNTDATIILINSGLDKLVSGGGGFFGFGGPSKFLQSFEACYYIKRASVGFLQFDFTSKVWQLWGVPRDAALEFQVVSRSETRPAFWEAEQTIKSLCRS